MNYLFAFQSFDYKTRGITVWVYIFELQIPRELGTDLVPSSETLNNSIGTKIGGYYILCCRRAFVCEQYRQIVEERLHEKERGKQSDGEEKFGTTIGRFILQNSLKALH